MAYRNSGWAMLLGLAVVTAACAASKGHGDFTSTGGTGGTSSTGGTGNGGSITITSPDGGTGQAFDVEPAPLQTITVTAGQTPPTVTYTATATASNTPVNVGWAVQQGNIGSMPAGPSSTAVFTPTGTTGGVATVQAGLNGKTVTRQVLVKLVSSQNGATASEQGQVATTTGQITQGGGVGGVGGTGLGPAASSSDVTALGAPTGNGVAQGLIFLYPYDKTVFPRGVLAPLLQWRWSFGDADAVKIQIQSTTGSFSWTGTFGRPAILTQTAGKLVNMPIPEDVWAMATNTAGGTDQLQVSLTVAKGGVAYGPVTETWTIAAARLSGTIYYNSYGTNYAQNSYPDTAAVTNAAFGGAVLSIRVGDPAPKLAAGTSTSADNTGCRVCHSVAAGGSRLVVQHGDNYDVSSAYDIATTGLTEHAMSNGSRFPAMSPDGSVALMADGLLLPLPGGASPIATTGLTSVVDDLGTPAFSPDGTKIVFNPQAGSLSTGYTIYTMSYDSTTHAFGAPTLIADDTASGGTGVQPGWPAFFPDSQSVVYHHQTVASQDRFDVFPTLYTRGGSAAQIYWTNTSGPSAVTPLDNLNGKGYLPKLTTASTLSCSADLMQVGGGPAGTYGSISNPDTDHADDVDHNYEPTVAPVAAGGYAWVVFTSRRMYGNVATIPPFCSDPRGVDLSTNVTTKKLWVAAIDLNQAPGKDSSHPAFYLPGQELLAGNSRGFWVLDPCSANGAACVSGDQCCNGFCEAGGDGGALVCSNGPPNSTCSGEGDKCTTAADCCSAADTCINGFCTLQSPP